MLNNYNDFNDSELCMLIKENNEDAKDIMYAKYNYIITSIIKKYLSIIKKLNLDYHDVYQEAMFGFLDAIDKYDENKDASLKTFISLCVTRRINAAIIKASRLKRKAEQEALSIDYIYDDSNLSLQELISDNNKNNPLEQMTKIEEINYKINLIKEVLSPKEEEVFNLLLNDLDYKQIAIILNTTPKSIDNAIQRIKAKVRKVINKEEN